MCALCGVDYRGFEKSRKLMRFTLLYVTVKVLIYTAKYIICKYGQFRYSLMCFIVTFKLKDDNYGIVVS